MVVIPDMTRIQSTSSARHNGDEKYKRFYEMRSPSEYPCGSFVGFGNFATFRLLFLHSVSKYLVRVFLLPGQVQGNEKGTVFRDLTVQSGNAGNKQIIISW